MHKARKVQLHYGDLTDSESLIRLIREIKPTEIYNLGAQSYVQVSFEVPEYTADCDATGVLRILEAVHFLGMEKTCRIYQASTSELFGLVQEVPQKKKTHFYPRSPYALAKNQRNQTLYCIQQTVWNKFLERNAYKHLRLG